MPSDIKCPKCGSDTTIRRFNDAGYARCCIQPSCNGQVKMSFKEQNQLFKKREELRKARHTPYHGPREPRNRWEIDGQEEERTTETDHGEPGNHRIPRDTHRVTHDTHDPTRGMHEQHRGIHGANIKQAAPIGPVVAKSIIGVIAVMIIAVVGFLIINGDIKLPHLGTTPITHTCPSSAPYYWNSDGMCHQVPENTGDGVCQAGWVVTDNPSFCCPAGYTDYNDGECCEACGNPQPSWDEELGIWIPSPGCPCIVGVYPQPVR